MIERFSSGERAALLTVRGVGPTVIQRLEEAGIASFSELATRDALGISQEIAAAVGTTCWRNSPLARAAVAGAIAKAKESNTVP